MRRLVCAKNYQHLKGSAGADLRPLDCMRDAMDRRHVFRTPLRLQGNVSSVGGFFFEVAGSRRVRMEAPMSKKFARRARLIREIAQICVAILQAAKLLIEFLSKTANCHVRELSAQVPSAR
jgi:hypothetical protein